MYINWFSLETFRQLLPKEMALLEQHGIALAQPTAQPPLCQTLEIRQFC